MTEQPRKRPCDRRPLETTVVIWTDPISYAQHRIVVGVGVDLDTGRVNEVFGSLEKPGSLLDLMLAESCRSLSHELQCGRSPAELLPRYLTTHDGMPMTPMGAVIAHLASHCGVTP
ncbi:MAG: hypothetical protein ACM31D_04675 [Bacteroidota bacterium]